MFGGPATVMEGVVLAVVGVVSPIGGISTEINIGVRAIVIGVLMKVGGVVAVDDVPIAASVPAFNGILGAWPRCRLRHARRVAIALRKNCIALMEYV